MQALRSMTSPFPLCGMRLFRAGLAGAAFLLFSGCAGPRPAAEALLAPLPGYAVTGRAVFAEQDDGVQLTAHVTGLGPGAHRLRLAVAGGCEASAADGRVLPLSAADAWSNAAAGAVLSGLTFAELPGKAVIVEAIPADPLACGVIAKH